MAENSPTTIQTQDPKKAMEFIGTVRQHYASNPEVYNAFLDVMKSIKSHNRSVAYFNTCRVDIPTMIAKVKKLFGNNAYLLQGFNEFLPPTCKIEIDASEVPTTPPAALTGHDEFGRAKEVVRKIKKRFENHPEIYENFLSILTNHYATGETNLENTIDALCKLFKNHPDLVEEFRSVLLFHPQKAVDLKKIHREPRPKRKTSEEDLISSHPVEAHVPHHSPKRVKTSEDEGFPIFPAELPERRKKSRKIDVPDQITWKEDDVSFLSEVKRNIGSHVLYSHFLRMMKLFMDDILSKDEFVQLCGKLFAAAPYLNERLLEFLHAEGYH